jgi:hypothetical protein
MISLDLPWSALEGSHFAAVSKPATGATENQDVVTVPTGEVWLVQSVAMFNATRLSTRLGIRVGDGVTLVDAATITPAGAFDSPVLPGVVLLLEGERVNCIYGGCTGGDVLWAFAAALRFNLQTP